MKRKEIIERAKDVDSILGHLQKKHCDNFEVNYAMLQNKDLLFPIADRLSKSINPELVSAEDKIRDIGRAALAEQEVQIDPLIYGLQVADKDLVERYQSLLELYNKSIDVEEEDISVVLIPLREVRTVKIEPYYLELLMKYVDKSV